MGQSMFSGNSNDACRDTVAFPENIDRPTDHIPWTKQGLNQLVT